MQTSNINVRIDTDVKNRSTEILKSIGMDMTTAINIYLRQIIENNGIPFLVQKRYNPDVEKSIDNVNNNVNLSREFSTVDELWEDLNADD